jgi:hypothetical protein
VPLTADFELDQAGMLAAIAQAPAMTMAHVLAAYLNLLGTEPAGWPAAREIHARAAALPATEREAMHVLAVGHLAHGRWHAAGRVLEDLSVRWPLDLLALQVGHQIGFFTAHSRMLRDRITRAESHWQEGMPGHHAVLSMPALGLEECVDHARTERPGRRSVELQPSDGWGWHAVAQVLEMQDRRRDGIAWLGEHSATWSEGSIFAIHNWWHLALFHLGLRQIDEVLALVDQRVLDTASSVVPDRIDGSAILWRLKLPGARRLVVCYRAAGQGRHGTAIIQCSRCALVVRYRAAGQGRRHRASFRRRARASRRPTNATRRCTVAASRHGARTRPRALAPRPAGPPARA